MPLPKWKNQLIQLLNIAGVGPVIGVILGIKFGKVALLVIPVGCVLMGAVHDFGIAMMSMRRNGANLPSLVAESLGRCYATVFSWWLVAILVLVVAVFINVPASIVDKSWCPSLPLFWPAVAVVFVYYIVATLFPVDRIIGRVYPFFGGLMIVGSLAVAVALTIAGFRNPEILHDCPGFAEFKVGQPIFPCIFVTIACGIISGFHATQSPIVVRTIKSEREARSTFYGMMILEGVIAMIWAAAALAIYNLAPENLNFGGATVLGNIATRFLGPWVGSVTVLAVIVLAITSGDTALRSARLSVAELCRIDQVPVLKRIVTCLPMIVAVAGLLWWSNESPKTFNNLWNYFAWGNQMIAVTALMTVSVWLMRERGSVFPALVTLVPGVFMATVVLSFIFWTPGTGGQPWGFVPGGLALDRSIVIGVTGALIFATYAVQRGFSKKN